MNTRKKFEEENETMDFIDYMKIKKRITKAGENSFDCSIDCESCPLYSKNNSLDVPCSVIEMSYPEKAEALVEMWSERHPFKTRMDKLLEIFPEAERFKKSLNICPMSLNTEYHCQGTCEDCRDKYWLSEYVELKKEENK